MKINKLLASFALAAIFNIAAFASVTFDAETGEGFVGKGDIQLAFDWNSAALHANAEYLVFTFSTTVARSGVCSWGIGQGAFREETHTKSITTTSSVLGRVAFDTRKNKQGQVTGFFLTGYEGYEMVYDNSSYDNPNYPMVLGGPCPGKRGNNGTWTFIEEGDVTEGGLYVTFGEESMLLPETL